MADQGAGSSSQAVAQRHSRSRCRGRGHAKPRSLRRSSEAGFSSQGPAGAGAGSSVVAHCELHCLAEQQEWHSGWPHQEERTQYECFLSEGGQGPEPVGGSTRVGVGFQLQLAPTPLVVGARVAGPCPSLSTISLSLIHWTQMSHGFVALAGCRIQPRFPCPAREISWFCMA